LSKYCLSDIFGKAGTKILDDLVNGYKIWEIMERITERRILNKKKDIERLLHGTLNTASILIIKSHLDLIQDINAKISELDAEIADMLQNLHEEELKILMGVPGVGSERSFEYHLRDRRHIRLRNGRSTHLVGWTCTKFSFVWWKSQKRQDWQNWKQIS